MNRIACSTSTRCNSPLDEGLSAISAAGFSRIDILAIDGWAHVHTRELVTPEGLGEAVRRTETLMKRYSLTPIAVNSGVGPQLYDRSPEAVVRRKAETEGLLNWMKALGISFAAIQPRQPDPDRPWEDALADCAASLRDQLELAAPAGVTLALEFHVNSPFETFEQCARIMELLPEMPLVYDPTHLVMQGIPLEETFRFLDRAVHVHVRDAAARRMQTRFGEGIVDFGRLLGELKARSYKGDFSIEYLQTDEFEVLEDTAKLYRRIEADFPQG
ncbi:sugar phosphate isomerase/epimerase [Paenibacillus rhizosphaerae]|uniref:Sugar phosphate isomerase/epimerase n=1 Tax=Paenibacillus rhizosphaerae TaxID=297318 RepID=A0A839TS03_9BACL|nr:sugar phosphate isomerase/epimerase [Paenibacillus rhizosphaerae]MBB3128440.1 sugar phosphate isomerase/epimerase [Paenibacillus rhizosphaerae]